MAQGTAVAVAATISPATPAPTGTAQLILDGNLYGAPVALTGGSTNLPLLTNTLQSGAHVVQRLLLRRQHSSGQHLRSGHPHHPRSRRRLYSLARRAPPPAPSRARPRIPSRSPRLPPEASTPPSPSPAPAACPQARSVSSLHPRSLPAGATSATTVLTISPRSSSARPVRSYAPVFRVPQRALLRLRSRLGPRRHSRRPALLLPPAPHPPLERFHPALRTLTLGLPQRLRQRRSRPQRRQSSSSLCRLLCRHHNRHRRLHHPDRHRSTSPSNRSLSRVERRLPLFTKERFNEQQPAPSPPHLRPTASDSPAR